MKKICLIVFCLSFALNVFAQKLIEKQPKIKDFSSFNTKNEISSNIFQNIFYINLSYERLLNSYLAINTTIGTYTGNYLEKSFSPKNILYSRIKIYFGDDICNGWFAQFGLGLFYYNRTKTEYNIETKKELTSTGVGLGFGYKFISSKKWFIESGAEVIAGFQSNNFYDFYFVDLEGIFAQSYPIIMVKVGKRF